MIIKTSALCGAQLDYAVAKCEGIPEEELYISGKGRGQSLFRRTRDEEGRLDGSYMTGPDLLFSTKWSAGGPIIEREEVNLQWVNGQCEADTSSDCFGTGSTPLIAAMRCYCCSKLGEEVEIPEELMKSSRATS